MVSPACLERILIGLIAAAVGAVAMPARLNAQSSGQRPSSSLPRLDRYGDQLPPGAALRLGTVRYRQDSPIYRIAFAPDGKHFVTDGEDSILRVWDADSGRLIRRIDPGVGALADFAITSRGKLVMALGMTAEAARGFVNNVTMTELATGLPVDVGSWDEPALGLHAVALCPDRQLIAMGMDKHGVRVLDAWTGAEICRFETGDREVERIVFSRDGKRLAVETQGKQVPDRQIELRLYDLAEKKESRVIRQDGFHMPAFAFSPDGSSIAVPINFDLYIWTVAAGEKTLLCTDFRRSLELLGRRPDPGGRLGVRIDQRVRPARASEGRVLQYRREPPGRRVAVPRRPRVPSSPAAVRASSTSGTSRPDRIDSRCPMLTSNR